ncbi:metallophosphoesterase [Falsirhodobacter xinxiangensis]|uniref:metallophosphoesterase n=1 Tax=Falsirhodobacter xinxiangensis TaxID=2530049 RepID=UPI0010A9D44D|nr:metallophosphoesterase [Rhodobacter xinxiangensis]
MFHLIKGLVGLYIVLRLVWPLPLPRNVRFALALLILTVSQHHLLSHFAFGSMFSPEVPREVMIIVNWVFGAMVIGFAFQLVVDAASLILSALSMRWRRVRLQYRYAVILAALTLSALGVSQAIRVPSVRTIEIALPNLPNEFDGFRMVQLTDLHLSRLFDEHWSTAVVERVNALTPDLIVITGDLIDGTTEARRVAVAPLADLVAAHGVIVSPGNHEYYFDAPLWVAEFERLGMRVLENEHKVIRRDDASLVIAGVTDARAPDFGQPAPDPQAALVGAPQEAPIVLLDHQPATAARNAQAGATMQLSGHTHGGMIRGFDQIVARFNNGYVSGLYEVDGMQLYVSNGTGLWIGFAQRIGVPSEITEIVLRKSF